MNKTVLAICVIISTFLTLSLPAAAKNTVSPPVTVEIKGSRIICFEDGSTLTISAPRIRSVNNSKSIINSDINAEYKDSSGNLEWRYTLYATFSYQYGVSSTCTNAYYDQTIYKGNWTFSNDATNISGNRGTGTGLYEKKFLFITIQSINVNLTMACDIYGNITA